MCKTIGVIWYGIVNTVMNGSECCASLFEPQLTFSQYGELANWVVKGQVNLFGSVDSKGHLVEL